MVSAVELHLIFSSPITSANRRCAERASNKVSAMSFSRQAVLCLGAV